MKIMKKRYIIVCFGVLLTGSTLFFKYVNRTKTTEYQIGDEIGMKEESIKFFDEQDFGEFRIVGFEYGAEQYGIARINLAEDPKVEEIKTTDNMLRRAEGIRNCPVSADGEYLYTFLCVNEELDSILWVENDQKRTFPVDHYPAVINVVYNPGSAEYYLIDKTGNELR